MSHKLAATASIIVIAATIAAAATISHGDGANTRLSTLCSSTLYRAKCEKRLAPFVNEASVLEEVLRAVLQVAMEEVAVALDEVRKGKGGADSITKSAMGECKKLLEDAMVDLKDMAGLSVYQMVNHIDDLRMWLSGVMTCIYTCADGFHDKPELKEAMDKLLQNSTELSSNALAIITRVGELLLQQEKDDSKTKDVSLLGWNVGDAPEPEPEPEVGGSTRRLVASNRLDDLSGSFPKWMSSHDRRLLLQQLPEPDAVVAADGSGNFKTITEAINSVSLSVPKNKSTTGVRFVIYVKAGDYKEYVTIPKKMPNIFMYGDGPNQTRVIGDKSKKGGFATGATATFSVEGNGFICKSMGFVNTAGPDGHQAVALYVHGDKSVFFNCRFEGYQDTLYVHRHRQFFRDCEVLGTIDFIFGNSAALFQNCLITVRKPMDGQSNMVTAHGRTEPNQPTGIVLQGCHIVPELALFPVRLHIASYLGRPWKQYARTVVMESTIGDLIKPEGWSKWKGDLGLNTLYYAEYSNTGPGAHTSKRVAWPGYHVIGQDEATQFTPRVFIDGINWINNTGTPSVMGFIK